MVDSAIVLMRHKFDVDSYHRMATAGIVAEHDRIELIDGELIDMAPISQRHAGVVNWLNRALVESCAGYSVVSPQNPLRVDRWNEPCPDFAILRSRADFYSTGAWPSAADVLLLVEVADSSLQYDCAVKLPLYAQAGIFEVWIVSVARRELDAYRQTDGEAYCERTTHGPGETIASALAPHIRVELARIPG